MNFMIGVLSGLVLFAVLGVMISLIHRIKYQKWPDGDEIMAGMLKNGYFNKKP